MRIAAIDQGTTSTRVMVVDQNGSADIQLALRHQQHHPHPGWVEHDPLELLNNIQRCRRPPGEWMPLALPTRARVAWHGMP